MVDELEHPPPELPDNENAEPRTEEHRTENNHQRTNEGEGEGEGEGESEGASGEGENRREVSIPIILVDEPNAQGILEPPPPSLPFNHNLAGYTSSSSSSRSSSSISSSSSSSSSSSPITSVPQMSLNGEADSESEDDFKSENLRRRRVL